MKPTQFGGCVADTLKIPGEVFSTGLTALERLKHSLLQGDMYCDERSR